MQRESVAQSCAIIEARFFASKKHTHTHTTVLLLQDGSSTASCAHKFPGKQTAVADRVQQTAVTQAQQQRNNLTQAREAHLSPVVMSRGYAYGSPRRGGLALCLRFRMSIIYICAFVSRLFVWCTRAEAAAQRGTSVTWGCLARIFKYSPRTGRRAEGAVQHEENHMLTGILACAACITSHRYRYIPPLFCRYKNALVVVEKTKGECKERNATSLLFLLHTAAAVQGVERTGVVVTRFSINSKGSGNKQKQSEFTLMGRRREARKCG